MLNLSYLALKWQCPEGSNKILLVTEKEWDLL